MKPLNIVILLLLSVLIYSCNHSGKETKPDSVAAMMSEPVSLEANVTSTPPVTLENSNASENGNTKTEAAQTDELVSKKKIIKDGTISIKSKEIETSKKNIDALVKRLNAYYEKDDLQNTDNTITYDLRIRIPSEKFETLVSTIESSKDEITNKSIQARDVTEEFIDIQSRLASKREYLKRYKEILLKASTIKDILAIEENIRVLQEEIESTEGRLKYLNDKVSFSTLDIKLYKEKEFVYKPQEEDKFSERVKKSLSSGWSLIINIIILTLTIWPLLIIALVFIYFIRKSNMKKKP